MTHDTRTADEIERDIARERSAMSSTIHDLQQKFSVNAIMDDVNHMVRDLRHDFGHSVSRTVSRNPAAVAVVGVGLAWLILGSNRNETQAHTDHRSDHMPGRQGFDEWDDSTSSWTDSSLDDDSAWFGTRRGSHGRSDKSSGMTGKLKGAAGSVKEAVSGAADNVMHTATDLRERVSHGLEDFSDEARERVLAARLRAVEAREKSGAALSRGSGAANDMFKEQPLIAGAIAVAVGAALGGVLPHSRIEDETMGESSDKLFREAQAVFREEREKAMAAVKGAMSDAKQELKDIGSELRSDASDLVPEDKTVGEEVSDRTSDAAKRVYESAKGNFEGSGSSNASGQKKP